MRSAILLLLCIVASTYAYQIIYTGYTDGHCGKVDNSVTGQIFENTCAPEFRKAPRSGKITQISATSLTSCDYSDTTCNTTTICETYNNGQCYSSTLVQFSNKYSWTANGDGTFSLIHYSAYNDQTCTTENSMSGDIEYQKCGAEFDVAPQSGKITFINDQYLTSCDYSDTQCQKLTICENYTNSVCYGSGASFSNSYSWNVAPTTAPVTNAPTQTPTPTEPASTTGSGGAKEFSIIYSAYEDSVCSTVDDSMTGEIFAYTCAREYSNKPTSGKIVYINDQYLTSCDYSDTQCATQTICENYNNSVCYSSATSDFSNKYSWSNSASGATIQYTSYSGKNCQDSQVNKAETGPITQGVCGAEFTKAPRSGKITFINEDYLVSCDYSDLDCQDLILCENYNNTQCYGSAVTSFSNKYSWVKSKTSSASTVACGLFAVVAIALAMF